MTRSSLVPWNKGAQCLLTVEHVTKRDGSGVFAAIAALSPVPAGFGVQSGGQTVGQSGGGAVVPRPAAVAPMAGASYPAPARPATMAPRPLNAQPGGPGVPAGMRPMAPSVAPAAAAPANDPMPF